MARNINNRQNICKQHLKYKGILKPRVNCEKCQNIYKTNNKNEVKNG
jgi:hypothetical protein